jgi:O-antigen/teichoic acid export membrane protein
MSRTRRATWNYLSTLLYAAVTLAVGLVATPYLMQWLRPVRFGAVRVLTEWYGYLALLELGLGGAMQPLLVRALGQGDEPALRRALAAGIRAYLKVTVLAVAVGLALVPVIDRLALRPEDRVIVGLVADLRRAWLVSLVGFVPLGLVPFKALVDAGQRGYWINLLLTGQSLLITALALTLARAGWGITGQMLAVALGVLPAPAVLAWVGARRHPGLFAASWSARPDPEDRRTLRGLSVPTLLVTLGGRLSLLTDYIIIGKLLGLESSASLFVTQRLAVLFQAQLQGLGGACWAGLAELHAQRPREVFNRRLVELTRMVAVLGVAGLGPIVAYNHRFFDLWMAARMGQEGYGGDAVIAPAAVNAWLLAVFSLWGWCFTGTGQIRRLVRPTVVGAIVNLAASIVLTRWLGLAGPTLGTTVAFLAVHLGWMPVLMRRTFGTPLGPLAWALIGPLAWGLPYGVGLWWLARAHPPAGWPGLIATMGLATLGFLAFAALLVLLDPANRALWRVRLVGVRDPVPGVEATEADRPSALP